MREVFGLSDQAGGAFYVHQRERLFSDPTYFQLCFFSQLCSWEGS